ncbi:MAG: cysteine hydrolase [candidate division WOR-3 bacterium]|nr:cysteine hydrolase [candidate division WOR-3 bacterium]MCX7757793.1 cysteine hydrolase [candidate division WOR-3 bacterium]MDW7987190.1 isochorismatase family cysteine hydrolase [candidate division WOR-3 bacterium]
MLTAQEIKKLIGPYQHKKLTLNPKECALLVIDMQNDFLDPTSPSYTENACEIVSNIKKLIIEARAHKIPIIYTAHVHQDPKIDGGMTAFWWDEIKSKKTLVCGTKGAEIIPELKPLPNDKIVYKHRYSAFYNTDLEVYLRGLGVSELIFTGIMTEICVESTVRDAFMRDYRIFIVADGTAAGKLELHVNSLKVIAYGFGYVTTTQSVINQIRASKNITK